MKNNYFYFKFISKKKGMKKFILWSVALILLGGGGFLAWHFFSPYKKIDIYSSVPGNPIFILETNNSYEMWEKLTDSKVWSVLRKHDLFSKFGDGIEAMDTIIHGNETLSKYIGKRYMIVSMHLLQKGKYDFLYTIDLRRISKLLPAKEMLKGLLSDYDVQDINFKHTTLFKLRDIENDIVIYISFQENLLLASFTQRLLEHAIDQIDHPKFSTDMNFISIRERLKENGMFRLYINYSQVDDYLNSMLVMPDPNLRQLSRSLFYTGLAFDITKDDLIQCEGYTNFNDTIVSSFRAMIRSGSGKTGLADVLPQQTASSVSIGFDRFTLYFDNMLANMQEAPKNYSDYEASMKQVEKFLKINIRDNLLSWVADEAAMVHLAPMGLGKSNEFAVFLKTRDIDDAKKNLDFISNQIRKRTPVKFQQVEYNGYTINYLSIKGFFKMMLGRYFQKLDKPYYTFIEDYVVFSNHPQTLKVIIDGVVNDKLLADRDDYNAFANNFSRRSNIFSIINTNQFYKSLQGTVNASTWAGYEKNKDYILCFPYIGFQLEEDGAMFKTKLQIQFSEKPEQTLISEIITPDSARVADTAYLPISDANEAKVNTFLSNAEEYVSDDPNAKVYLETYSNGKTKVEFELKDGFRDGDFTEYYENGELKIKGQYSHDKKEGVWKIYDETGELLMRVKFVDGKRKD
jgi:hypothetical protein